MVQFGRTRGLRGQAAMGQNSGHERSGIRCQRSGALDCPGTSSPWTEGRNPAAVALGRLGGLKGGKVRATRLTAEQRAEIARKGARARWANPGQTE